MYLKLHPKLTRNSHKATQLLHHPGLISVLLLPDHPKNGTLIGMKSMDEGKPDF